MGNRATDHKALMTEGHLSDTGILLYVDGLKLQKQEELPREILEHVSNCERCRLQVFEYYEFNKDEPVASPHPYFDAEKNDGKQIAFNWKRLGVAASVLLLTGTALLFYLSRDREPYDGSNGNGHQTVKVPHDRDSSTTTVEDTPLEPERDSSKLPQDRDRKQQQEPPILQDVPSNMTGTLASVDTPIPSLDRQIARRRVRGFEMTSPVLDAELSEHIRFQWNSTLSDSLMITVFNQKTQKTPQVWNVPPAVTEFEVTTDGLVPGLYYWEVYQVIGGRKKKIGLGRVRIN